MGVPKPDDQLVGLTDDDVPYVSASHDAIDIAQIHEMHC